MISAMNADNLSCAFCFEIYCYLAFVHGSKTEGHSYGQKGYSMDKRNVPTSYSADFHTTKAIVATKVDFY